MSNKINHNLMDLADHERLWLVRVFEQGVSQDEMAPRTRLSHNHYVAAELGRRDLTPLLRQLYDYRIPPLEQRLRLARKRSGKQLKVLARALGVSHVTLLKMERRADARLVAFWRARGFKF